METVQIEGKDFTISAWPVSGHSILYGGKQLFRVVVIRCGLDAKVFDGKVTALGEEEACRGVKTMVGEEIRIGTRDKEGFRI